MQHKQTAFIRPPTQPSEESEIQLSSFIFLCSLREAVVNGNSCNHFRYIKRESPHNTDTDTPI